LRRFLSYGILVFLCLSGCREEFLFEAPVEETRLNLFAEINPADPVSLSLLTSYTFGSNGSFEAPEDAQIFLDGRELGTKGTNFAYDEKREKYMLTNPFFRPREKNYYEVMAFVPGMKVDTIYAKTYVPVSVPIEDFIILSNEALVTGNEREKRLLRLQFRIATPKEFPAYLHVLPQRFISEFRTNDQGEVIITDSNDSEHFTIAEIANNKNAVVSFDHKEGVFIDHSRLGEDYIELELITQSSLSTKKDVMRLLKFEIRTITQELYDYHVSLHRQLISNRTSLTYPVNQYSNVENGRGIFGAYSAKVHIVPL
jgi:hypothetical protein